MAPPDRDSLAVEREPKRKRFLSSYPRAAYRRIDDWINSPAVSTSKQAGRLALVCGSIALLLSWTSVLIINGVGWLFDKYYKQTLIGFCALGLTSLILFLTWVFRD